MKTGNIKGRARGKTKLRFADMPSDYVSLCQLYLPRPIRDEADYESMMAMAGIFA